MADSESFMEQWITDPTAVGIELPDFVVQIGSYTNSTDQGGASGGTGAYANCIRLYRFTERLSRAVNPNAINQLFTGGRMQSSAVGIEIPRVNGLSNMINALSNGENIPQIIIQRIGQIQKGSKTLEKIEYDNCLFTLYHYVTVKDAQGNTSDRARLAFRPLKRTQTIISYKQDDGTQQGQTQSVIDFTTGDFTMGGGDSGGGGGGGDAV
ncbi:hypothetical protein Bealeia2_00793 [Candidatus Bealeia paramacronuclearis]|uniref:hypothetical protein n=1 Tax=Candidatus Bealeia paramacronuclearis TaxID=1921001 RepID=UPI002CD50F00|nr:hypothetical protein [Candidatus Bealeia paramacronuclearis]